MVTNALVWLPYCHEVIVLMNGNIAQAGPYDKLDKKIVESELRANTSVKQEGKDFFYLEISSHVYRSFLNFNRFDSVTDVLP